MKFILLTASLLAFEALLQASPASAMAMSTMLMAQPLESFLSDLVSFGDLTVEQKQTIMHMADDTDAGYRTDVFSTKESKDILRSYLYAEVDTGDMGEEAAEIIASTLSLGGLHLSGSAAAADIAVAAMELDGPVQAVYDLAGQGNMRRRGKSTTMLSSTSSQVHYNGIWGYAVGDREYALVGHGLGLVIIDVTDPENNFQVQLISMGGGGIWRDVATHFDSNSGKTYAYVAAQGTQSGGTPNLFVVDLSYLSGDINNPNGENLNPIPPEGYVNRGEADNGHTLNVARGLLFLNTAYTSRGCRVFDLTVDPWNPSFLFDTAGSGRACHDSFVRENIDGKDILFVSDGGGSRERIYDITNVDANTSTRPPQIGAGTQVVSGIYAHESWLTEDNRYLFEMDENSLDNIIVHDVTDLANPVIITVFQYSEEASSASVPHNGEIRGNYFYVAYYAAGLRVFDISNPYLPVEVGKVETYRDPNGDGNYERSSANSYNGAWNTYPYLPSGNILVTDRFEGLYIVNASKPYDRPADPTVSAQREPNGSVTLTWNAVANACGYAVERSTDGTSYTVIAEHLVPTITTYVDSSAPGIAFYVIKAVNGEGVGSSTAVAADGTLSPTKTPSKTPTDAPTTATPTTSPSKQPTGSPVLPGFCSDDPATRCSTVSQCTCGPNPGSESIDILFNRKLQTDPCNERKKTACVGDCTWSSGTCVATGPVTPNPTQPPTAKPTNSPSKSPTNKPTRSPTSCQCFLTEYPTSGPTPNPTNPPTGSPIVSPTPPTCLAKGATCPPNPADCCNGFCETKGQNQKCA